MKKEYLYILGGMLLTAIVFSVIQLTLAVAPNPGHTQSEIESLSGYTVPSGMIAMFDVTCPSGWTRFTVLDDKFPQGATTYGGTGGSNSITLSVGQLPAHNHTGTAASGGSHAHSIRFAGNDYPSGTVISNEWATYTEGGWSTGYISSAGAHTHSLTIDNAGSGSSINITNAYLGVIWCKKN